MSALTAQHSVYNCNQGDVTEWLRNELGLDPYAPVYFDDADLVWRDKTVLEAILVNRTAKLGRLRTALRQHIAAKMSLADQIRSRCEQLHNLETMEPEDVYQQVADEFGIDIEELNDILESDE